MPATNFSAQARRLYARFLHVGILVLRPALEHLFQNQRHRQPSVAHMQSGSGGSPQGSPRVVGVQDLIVSGIAAQLIAMNG